MATPTLKELRTASLSAGGTLGQAHGADRPEAHRKASVAKIAYHAARVMEECTGVITEADVDYICSVMHARIKDGR